MPRPTVDMGAKILTLLLVSLAVARAMPKPEDEEKPPFFQFTKGGIRINFGGYHAQAGLGGLLTGNPKDGGLHASAGTPSGAHAGAGLGGTLEGGPAGGLHARAGLGNGGPEAEAGLGGTLVGPKPGGEIYARSSVGDLPIPAIQKTKGKNVQVIAPPKKANDELTSSSSSSVATAKADASTSDDAATGVVGKKEEEEEDSRSEAERNEHPARWYFKKRLRERVEPTQKTTADNTVIPPSESDLEKTKEAKPAVVAKPTQKPNWKRFAYADDSEENTQHTSSGGYNKGRLFDDIFNIPISALKAVNTLLKNHVG